jgi:calcium/calmodulin-dependent protein kinase (CaM kinase) II
MASAVQNVSNWTKETLMADATTEVLEANRRLLESINSQDWNAYAALCDASLTCFEPEALGHVVAGMDFHKFYFQLEASSRPKQSTMASPHVRLMGDVAVVSYIRLTQRVEADGHPATFACEETRVWQKQSGVWKHVHFHRSIPAAG